MRYFLAILLSPIALLLCGKPVLNAFRDQVLYLKHNLNARAISKLRGEFGDIKLDIDLLIRDMQRSIDESRKFVATQQQS